MVVVGIGALLGSPVVKIQVLSGVIRSDPDGSFFAFGFLLSSRDNEGKKKAASYETATRILDACGVR